MPIKGNSPLLGYNTNVRHKGHLFHIQTEDSGIDHPHVITHLFTEGTILATKKTSYAKIVGATTELEEHVRTLMKDQHKAMFVELRDGAHDAVAARLLGPAFDAAADENEKPAARASAPVPPSPSKVAATAAAPEAGAASKRGGGDERSGAVKLVIPAHLKKVAAAPASTATAEESAKKTKSAARSIFETPGEDGEFGESLISDKSLDEVILSYLTDDDLKE